MLTAAVRAASPVKSGSMTKRFRRGEFHPIIFKLMATEDKLTAAAGLATIMEMFDQSPLASGFKVAAP